MRLRLIAIAALVVSGLVSGAAPASATPVERGAYIFQAAGCLGCHTDKKNKGAPLAGGRALKTEFGTFYTPNITPDGLKGWTLGDFQNAMRHGIRPDGAPYYPAFPYTAYTNMADADIADLWAYLSAQPAIDRANTPHDLKAPFGWRTLLWPWRWLFLEEGPKDMERGAYLANALGHCGECHSPRGMFGQLDQANAYSGTKTGPKGGIMPNITPDKESGVGGWDTSDFDFFFRVGLLPDGDVVGGTMSEVIDNTTAKLTAVDRTALIGYLKSLPPIFNPDLKKAPKPANTEDDW